MVKSEVAIQCLSISDYQVYKIFFHKHITLSHTHTYRKFYYKSIVTTLTLAQTAVFLAIGTDNTAESTKTDNGNTNDWSV